VALRYRLEPFNLESTDAYIKHRLRMADSKKMLFTRQAVEAIHHHSRGIPRLINTLCDNGLFEAALSQRAVVDRALADHAARTLGLDFRMEETEAVRARRQAGVLVPGESDAGRITEPTASKPVTMAEIDSFLDRLGKV
jgi:hypothetical protein